MFSEISVRTRAKRHKVPDDICNKQNLLPTPTLGPLFTVHDGQICYCSIRAGIRVLQPTRFNGSNLATGGLQPIISSWRQALWDSQLEMFRP
jgi:hypothetical protein